jgi:cell shape-determining protein MreD
MCYRCKTPREADDAQIEERKAAAAAQAATPEKVPDLLVALPVVIFRSYSRVWIRGGLGVLGILAFLVFGGVTDIGYLALTGGLGAGLVVIGFLAGEVSDAMRNREAWAFIIGAGLSVVAVVGSVMAFEILAPGLVNPTAIRWGSVIIFGGAGVAAIAGLVLLYARHEAEA